MRLKAKKIGDEISLDEYNAYQYLLYHMDCWKDPIHLDMATEFKGEYATYILEYNTVLLNEKQDTYKITTQLTHETNMFSIKVSDIETLLDSQHLDYTITYYYKKPLTDEDGTVYDANDDEEVNDTPREQPTTPNTEEDYEKKTVPCSIFNNKIKFPLLDEKNISLPPLTRINRMVTLNIIPNNVPWIDINNGKANEPDEILIDQLEHLEHILKYAPHDNTNTIIRLDSNKTYNITQPFIINKGQNITIRGGTNQLAWLLGDNKHRAFIVKPGATLSLQHVALFNNNSTTEGTYDIGKGGAILVESDRRLDGSQQFGKLRCNNCIFTQNKAEYGGAVFGYNAGIFLDTCTFTENKSSKDGGAIYYWARDVKIDFPDKTVINGTKASYTATITDYAKKPVKEGFVEFYRKTSGGNEFIQKVNVNESKGTATLEYTLPENNTERQLKLIAVFLGTDSYEQEVAMNTVTVKFPETYKANFTCTLEGFIGDTFLATASVKDEKGNYITKPKGTFTINNETFTANVEGDFYIYKYPVPEGLTETKIPISFEIESGELYKCEKITDNLQIKDNIVVTENKINNYVQGLFFNGQESVKENGVWVDKSVTTTLINGWVNAGITDIFVMCRDYSSPKSRSTLLNVLDKTKGKGLRIHAMIHCFADMTKDTGKGRWSNVNPSKKERLSYIQTNMLNPMINDKIAIDGICLDYIRFSGIDEYCGGIAKKDRQTYVDKAVDSICAKIKDQKPEWVVSACLMGESGTASTYGQNYETIGKKVDYIIPMLYKSAYDFLPSDGAVKQAIINWILPYVDKSKIICGMDTYRNEKKAYDTRRTKTELDATIRVLAELEIKGIAMFREFLLPVYPMTYRNAILERGGK